MACDSRGRQVAVVGPAAVVGATAAEAAPCAAGAKRR